MNIKIHPATPKNPTSTDTQKRDEVTDKPWPELSFMRTPDEGTRYRSDNNYSYSYLSPPTDYDACWSGSEQYSYRNPQPPYKTNRGYSYNPQPPSPTPAASPLSPYNHARTRTSSYPPYPLLHPNPKPQHHNHHYQPPYLHSSYPHRNPRHPIRIINTLPYYLDTLGRLYTPLSPTGDFTHHWPPGFFLSFLRSLSNSSTASGSGRCITLLHHLAGVLKMIPLRLLRAEEVGRIGRLCFLVQRRRLVFGCDEGEGFMGEFERRHAGCGGLGDGGDGGDGGDYGIECGICREDGFADMDPMWEKLGMRGGGDAGFGFREGVRRMLQLLNHAVVRDQEEECWDLFMVVLPRLGRFLVGVAETGEGRFE